MKQENNLYPALALAGIIPFIAGALIGSYARLAGCGDWFRHGRVEAAFLSGWEVAGKLRVLIERSEPTTHDDFARGRL